MTISASSKSERIRLLRSHHLGTPRCPAQSIIAAEVGYHDLALRYFHNALFVDLADLHENTTDGVHVASTGGVWNVLVYGFGGMRDHNGVITLIRAFRIRGRD